MKGKFTRVLLRVLPCPQDAADRICLEVPACSAEKKLIVTLECSYLVIYLAKEDSPSSTYKKQATS